MKLFGYLAGKKLAAKLRVPDAGDLGDSPARAGMSARHDTDDSEVQGGKVPAPAVVPEDHPHQSPRPAWPDDGMSELVDDIVRRLFSIGLSLESARSVIEEGLAADRIAFASGELDCMIRDIRTAVIGRADLGAGVHARSGGS